MDIEVCFGKSCVRSGAREVAETLQRTLEAEGVPVRVQRRACLDLCKQPCNVLTQIGSESRIYTQVHPKTAYKTAAQMLEPVTS